MRSISLTSDLFPSATNAETPKCSLSANISIVAPAYNEEKTIIDNVQSLLRMDYPNFEVCIVNDGSKDKTLELLIDTFDLVEVPFEYVEKVHCAPFK